jgi:hypothetical protein
MKGAGDENEMLLTISNRAKPERPTVGQNGVWTGYSGLRIRSLSFMRLRILRGSPYIESQPASQYATSKELSGIEISWWCMLKCPYSGRQNNQKYQS